jgi:hypothetical protein
MRELDNPGAGDFNTDVMAYRRKASASGHAAYFRNLGWSKQHVKEWNEKPFFVASDTLSLIEGLTMAHMAPSPSCVY